MPRLRLFQVFAGQLLLSGPLGLLHVFLQFFQQIFADKLLLRYVSAQLLVFIHGNPVGQKVLRRQILKSPAAEATLNNIVPNGFFRADNKAALGELLLRQQAFRIVSWIRHPHWQHILEPKRYSRLHYLLPLR